MGRAEGDAFPLAIRVVHVARDAAYQRLLGGDDHAKRIVRERVGQAFDPEIANRLADRARRDHGRCRRSRLRLGGRAGRRAASVAHLPAVRGGPRLAAIGNFADLVSPSLSGHSEGVAELAEKAARVAGFEEADARLARRGAHVHDLGRVAVHPRIWERVV